MSTNYKVETNLLGRVLMVTEPNDRLTPRYQDMGFDKGQRGRIVMIHLNIDREPIYYVEMLSGPMQGQIVEISLRWLPTVLVPEEHPDLDPTFMVEIAKTILEHFAGDHEYIVGALANLDDLPRDWWKVEGLE